MKRYKLYDSGLTCHDENGDYVLYFEAAKEIESLRAKLAEAEKALKHYADRNEWSGYPWKLQYNSSHIDGDGWVTAETALNTIANESKTRSE